MNNTVIKLSLLILLVMVFCLFFIKIAVTYYAANGRRQGRGKGVMPPHLNFPS